MISKKDFLSKIKDVNISDIISVGKLIMVYPFARIFSKFHKDLWLICEDINEARDNGYWFYKYMREKHPEKECYYAINTKSVDYQKVAEYGNIIEYGSLKHWLYYLAASKNISSQKGGKPNAAACYLFEINGWLKNNRIFLQHGIIKDDLKWLYYDVCKFNMFICGAAPEYEYVSEKFGYPEGVVRYTGLSRHDGLHDFVVNKRKILVMPTWRNWFVLNSKNDNGHTEKFIDSEYLIKWKSFLNNKALHEYLYKNNLELVFYPHRNMQKYIVSFEVKSKNITIADWKQYDIQKLLKESAVLITDYSSVFMDFAYMKKPIIFYQFDEERFRKTQYQQGYFDYKNNGFGNTFYREENVLDELIKMGKRNFEINEKFEEEHKRFFKLYDTCNCERIYNEIIKNDNRSK